MFSGNFGVRSIVLCKCSGNVLIGYLFIHFMVKTKIDNRYLFIHLSFFFFFFKVNINVFIHLFFILEGRDFCTTVKLLVLANLNRYFDISY